MGRGRQKAKHMKVARKLKYFSPETDLDALQRELTSSGDLDPKGQDVDTDEDDFEDKWADDRWEPPAHSRSSAWDDYEG